MRPVSAGKTDRGRRRLKNEDSIGIFDDLGLYIVADGMGGHAAGEVASRVAVEAVRAGIKKSELPDPGEKLVSAIAAANMEVLKESEKAPGLKGMGATIAAVLLSEAGRPAAEAGGLALTLAHVGDSRIYLYRNGELKRLTRDHSMVEDMVAAGQITPAQARVHPFRNIVTRALGTKEDVQADLSQIMPMPGDLFLLCSDGLTGMLEDGRTAEIMAAFIGSPFACAEALVKAANDAGGDDNISVVLLKF